MLSISSFIYRAAFVALVNIYVDLILPDAADAGGLMYDLFNKHNLTAPPFLSCMGEVSLLSGPSEVGGSPPCLKCILL